MSGSRDKEVVAEVQAGDVGEIADRVACAVDDRVVVDLSVGHVPTPGPYVDAALGVLITIVYADIIANSVVLPDIRSNKLEQSIPRAGVAVGEVILRNRIGHTAVEIKTSSIQAGTLIVV